jgi:hypothetical protein
VERLDDEAAVRVEQRLRRSGPGELEYRERAISHVPFPSEEDVEGSCGL